jgi:hypothetical protein
VRPELDKKLKDKLMEDDHSSVEEAINDATGEINFLREFVFL